MFGLARGLFRRASSVGPGADGVCCRVREPSKNLSAFLRRKEKSAKHHITKYSKKEGPRNILDPFRSNGKLSWICIGIEHAVIIIRVILVLLDLRKPTPHQQLGNPIEVRVIQRHRGNQQAGEKENPLLAENGNVRTTDSTTISSALVEYSIPVRNMMF